MNSHDKIIVDLFVKKNNLLNAYRIHKVNVDKKYELIKNYLANRYNDSFSLNETIRRIQCCIELHPKCPICGKYVKYHGYKHGKIVFSNTCSFSCGSKMFSYKVKETKLARYGDANYNNNVKIKQTKFERYGDANYNNNNKTRETCLSKYGVPNGGGTKKSLEKIKETNLKRYGYEMPLQSSQIRNKIKETNKIKYGTEYPLSSKMVQDKRKETCIHKYGALYPMQVKSVSEKSYNERVKRHTWSSSKVENTLYDYIKERFPLVKRQYKDIRYPWHCDFYIPDLDYFIEVNGYWTHGSHPFDSTNINDLNKIKIWNKKYDNGNHPLYKRAIEGWTIFDVKKREYAKKNNLNFKEVWNLEEGKEFIDKLAEKYAKMSFK